MTETNRGLNLSDVTSVTGPEREQFGAFYTSILGHTHRGLDYLLDQDPATLKRYRQRFETCARELPKQIVPTTLLHYNVIRGLASGIRDNILLARAFGVSKHLVLNTIGSASLTGIEAFDLVHDATGDIFATWDAG